MPRRDIHDKPFTAETITKLKIFEEYLKTWLPVFIHGEYDEINICDFFAGCGKDRKGIQGSPLRIISVLDAYRGNIASKKIKINVLLNEFNPEKYLELQKETNALMNEKKISGLVTVEYYNQQFKDLFNNKKSTLKNKANLFFLDQNGIKEISNDIFQEIIRFKTTDFLFFISSSYIRRFANDPAFCSYLPGIDVEKIKSVRYYDIHRILVDNYKQRIPENNTTKLYPFTIKKGQRVYGLVFGTKHILGADKFLHLVWKENELNGEANFDIDNDENIQTNFFEPPRLTKIEAFQKELKEYLLSRKSFTNGEIYEYTLQKGHIPTHAVELLRTLKEEQKIDYDKTPNISYNKVYKHKDIKTFQVLT